MNTFLGFPIARRRLVACVRCRRWAALCLTLWLPVVARAAEPEVALLWPDGAPGAVGSDERDRPTLTIHRPEAAAKPTAVVVCPGGGYGGLALDHEGKQVAAWLNENGVTALVLRYRHAPRYRHPTPLGDVQRAIRIARHRAASLGYEAQRIGVLGFSAGGHLASSAGTHFDAGNAAASDPIDRLSCRPDWMVLIYPVITMTESYMHAGSRKNLLGDQPDEALATLMSNDKQVTADTPPAFLVHTAEDKPVPCENSLAMYSALRRAGILAELHVYEGGPHGFGLGRDNAVLSTWPTLCIEWMKRHEFLPK